MREIFKLFVSRCIRNDDAAFILSIEKCKEEDCGVDNIDGKKKTNEAPRDAHPARSLLARPPPPGVRKAEY